MDTALELLPLPTTHAHAMRLLSDPDVEIGELARVIESDAALTASMLRGANSAASSPIERIDTANTAVLRLGLGQSRRIIIGAVTSSAFGHLHRAEIDADATWRHLVSTALLAQAVMWGRGTPRGAVSEAFTAGMLHDIGRLSMATQDANRYSLVTTLTRSGANVTEAEMRMFGFEHADWGERISEAWNIPDNVRDAILHHHGGGGELAKAVLLAREISWSLGDRRRRADPAGGDLPQGPLARGGAGRAGRAGGAHRADRVVPWRARALARDRRLLGVPGARPPAAGAR